MLCCEHLQAERAGVVPVKPKERVVDRSSPAVRLAGLTGTAHLHNLAWLRRVRDRIDRDYSLPLDVEALGRGVHMSAGHLSREFSLAYGESPYSSLMTRRVERAMALLRRGDLSVTEVCFAVGCASLGTFSARFTEFVGMSPGTYRRQSGRGLEEILPCMVKALTSRSGIEKRL